MVAEGSGVRGQRSVLIALLVAALAVLPLLAPEVWTGFRLAFSDPFLSVIVQTEQPLSVRSPGGIWAMALAVAWFGLAYWQRKFALWEAVLVLLGGAAALARVGNLWVDAAFMLLPLARQLSTARVPGLILCVAATASVAIAILTVATGRPPELQQAVVDAARTSASRGSVMADWRWATDLQQRLGGQRRVFASGGLASESSDAWLDYLRVAQGHERWADALRTLEIDTVVLNASDQQLQAAALIRGSSDWRVLYDAAGTLVAERTTP
jgi:hypothetical protein